MLLSPHWPSDFSLVSSGGWLLLLCCLAAIAEVPEGRPTLKQRKDGGWETADWLPYAARVSPQGYLESLRVADFEFVAPRKTDSLQGIFLADGATALPFTTITTLDNGFTAGNDAGKLTVRFTNSGLEATVQNRSIANGHCLHLGLSANVARIKAAARGIEYAMPLKSTVATPARVIAPNGASLSFGEARSYDLRSGGYLHRDQVRYLVKFPHVRAGSRKTFTVAIHPTTQPEDAIKVAAEIPASDHTFWTDKPQQLATRLTNADAKQTFQGEMILRLRSYLTKQVEKEMRQEVSLAGGAQTEATWRLADLEPMLYLAEFWVRSGGREGLSAAPRVVWNASALRPPDPPEDFDAFWKRTLDEQSRIPPDLQIKKVKDQGQHEVLKFSFAGLLGHRCYGWLTLPKDKSRKWPAALVMPPAGMRSQPIPIFNGAVGMRININTVDVDLPEDQYDWRTWPAPYLVSGILDRDHYCLRFAYAATVRAAEVLAARPEVDPAHIRLTGSSQGGGLAFIAAGLYSGFESAQAIKPGLCRLDWNLNHLQPPFFPIGVNDYTRQEIENTLRYFLPSHFARKIKCPISVSFALHDDITPAVGVFCAYNAIPGAKKTIAVDPHATH